MPDRLIKFRFTVVKLFYYDKSLKIPDLPAYERLEHIGNKSNNDSTLMALLKTPAPVRQGRKKPKGFKNKLKPAFLAFKDYFKKSLV